MAYMSQERKAELAPGIQAVLKKYGMKGSIAVRHHMSLVVTVTAGKIDFQESYLHDPAHTAGGRMQINPYHLDRAWQDPALAFLEELSAAMNVGNFDKSDYQSDYHHVGWYTDINVGKWDKPYTLLQEA
jgi:hypothetical protein